MTAEEWRPVVGFPAYQVSSLGRILSLHAGAPRLLKPTPSTRGVGYLTVNLCRDKAPHMRLLHRVVAEAFHGTPSPGQQVRHLDGDHLNNRPSNLVFGSPSENTLDQVRHGRHIHARKTHCKSGHTFDEANTYWNPSGARRCRRCRADGMRATNQRRAFRAAGIPA